MKGIRFVILDVDLNSEVGNRTLPAILAVPDDVSLPDDSKSKDLMLRAIKQSCPHRLWRWNRKCALSENDAASSPLIKSMFEAVDWSSVEPLWLTMPDNPSEAYDYVNLVGPSREVENLLAKDTFASYKYAIEILRGRFPDGEEAIGKDAIKSINYADFTKRRLIQGEGLISEHEGLSFEYGKIMKKHNLWNSWTEEELARSPVWMYQYAKDHARGRLCDILDSRMHLLSFENSENKWIKKYLGAKKYQ